VSSPSADAELQPVLEVWSLWQAVLMLLAGAAVVALELAIGWLSLAVAASFGALLWLARARYTPRGSFGAANAVTLLRLLLLCALGLGRSPPGPREALVLLLVLALDGLDGWLARRNAASSAFGARFDMEVDACMVLLAALLLFVGQRLGPFILVAGALRYAYVLLLALAPRARAEAPASSLGRHAFALTAVALCASAWPLPHHRWLAAAATLLLAWSFARSLVWSLRRPASS
jgi:phosphatidylglycerophosphate synthase